jgi:hypothetical protein
MTPKVHGFDVECAKLIGVDCAIVLALIAYWVAFNRANDKNFKQGRFWTYNSAKAWTQHCPYYTAKQIRRILDELESGGFILKDNFNENAYDRTLWYALTEKGESICLSGKMEEPVQDDGEADPVFSVDQCKTNTEPKRVAAAATEVIETPPILCTPAFGAKWQEWIEFRKSIKKPLKSKAMKMQLAELATIGETKARECIDHSMRNQYQGLFPERFKSGAAKFQGKSGGTFSSDQYGENPFGGEERRETA